LPRLVGELLVEAGNVVRRGVPPGGPARLVAPDPVEHARDLARDGLRTFLVHDVDGGRAGEPRALVAAAAISAIDGVEVWYRGGLQTPEAVESAQEAGVSLCVLDAGSIADAAFLRYALDTLGGQAAVALEADGSRIVGASPAAPGASLADAAGELAFRGVSSLVVWDVARAGTLAGPNLSALRGLLDGVRCGIAYGGGVATTGDLRALRDLGRATLRAVLVATALGESRFTAGEAVEILEHGA
jgi:phosphoribosylformimino-5-aminoimidazole carboxamide ribotide isomerase